MRSCIGVNDVEKGGVGWIKERNSGEKVFDKENGFSTLPPARLIVCLGLKDFRKKREY